MKKNLYCTFFAFFILFSASMQGENDETNQSQFSSEVSLPSDYFTTETSSSGENYQEQSTTEGPDGPPAPIDDWVSVFFIVGIIIASRNYFYSHNSVNM